MPPTLKAIETAYKGYRFRSRTEARWAVFLDALGIEWEYEKQGYDLGQAGHYLPDFWLPKESCWLEIKGVAILLGEPADLKCAALAVQSETSVYLVVGLPAVAAPATLYTGARGGQPLKRALTWGRPVPELERAVLASRSARFEFGESGAGAPARKRSVARRLARALRRDSSGRFK